MVFIPFKGMDSIPNDTIKKIYSEFLSFFRRGFHTASKIGPITPLGFPKSGHPAHAILIGNRVGGCGGKGTLIRHYTFSAAHTHTLFYTPELVSILTLKRFRTSVIKWHHHTSMY